VDKLIDNLLGTFPAVFRTSGVPGQKKRAIDRGFNQRYDREDRLVETQATGKTLRCYRDAQNIAFTPMRMAKRWTRRVRQLPEEGA